MSDCGARRVVPSRIVMGLAAPWARWWFRVRLAGRDLLPNGPCLVAASHSGLGFADLAAVIWLQGDGASGRPFRAAAHRLLTAGLLAPATRAAGGVRGDRESVVACLRRGLSVLVCPGGCKDSMRPLWRARRCDWGRRIGFAEVALEAGVPIVPLAIHGSAATYWLLGSVPLPRVVVRAFGGAVRAVPLTAGMLVGTAALTAAGLGAVPGWVALAAVAAAVLPLPASVTVEVLPAVSASTGTPETVAESVRSAVEAALRRGPPRSARRAQRDAAGWPRRRVRV